MAIGLAEKYAFFLQFEQGLSQWRKLEAAAQAGGGLEPH
jgi:hypothetical protein